MHYDAHNHFAVHIKVIYGLKCQLESDAGNGPCFFTFITTCVPQTIDSKINSPLFGCFITTIVMRTALK